MEIEESRQRGEQEEKGGIVVREKYTFLSK